MQTSPKNQALLVDGDADDLDTLRRSFAELDFDLVETDSMRTALELTRESSPSIILSELRLTDGSGFSLCRKLREEYEENAVLIVLVSSWATEADRILAFECGADDFIPKPFYPRELTSRIRAITRRTHRRHSTRIDVQSAGIRMDPSNYTVWVHDREQVLTPQEFAIFVALADRAGRVVRRPDLIDAAWQSESRPGVRSVDTHVKSLRSKLGDAGKIIETVRGVGYRVNGRVKREV